MSFPFVVASIMENVDVVEATPAFNPYLQSPIKRKRPKRAMRKRQTGAKRAKNKIKHGEAFNKLCKKNNYEELAKTATYSLDKYRRQRKHSVKGKRAAANKWIGAVATGAKAKSRTRNRKLKPSFEMKKPDLSHASNSKNNPARIDPKMMPTKCTCNLPFCKFCMQYEI